MPPAVRAVGALKVATDFPAVPKKIKTPSLKSQVAPTNKLIAESQKQYKRDLTEKWRFLKRIGAYQTKEAAAQDRLTKSRIRAIEKKFKEINSMKKLVRGHTVRPVKLVSYKTPKGRAVVKYDFTPSFSFVRTKYKPSMEAGIKKVGKKGYIIERTSLGSKIRVNKKGDIIEVRGSTQRKRRRYQGKDLLKLLDSFDRGTYKFKKNDLIVFHRWGSPSSVVDSRAEGARLISNYIREKSETMSSLMYDRFIDASYIEIVSEREIDNEQDDED